MKAYYAHHFIAKNHEKLASDLDSKTLIFVSSFSFYKLHSVFKNKLLIMFVDKSLNHQGGTFF
jgi:hypothetical protein